MRIISFFVIFRVSRKKIVKSNNYVTHQNLIHGPQESRIKRQEMREISRFANSIGYTGCKVVGNKLMVNGTPYLEDELHLLPTNLLLANIRTRRVRDGIGFSSKESYLSNFYATTVMINGQRYSSSEQAYQHCKAVSCGRDDIANAIMQLSDPKKIKHQGDRVEIKKNWEDQKYNVMKYIVTGKFLQNAEIRGKLENTGSTALYECTTNTFWGTGWRIESPQWKSTNSFPGNNQLGKILEEVRDLIRSGGNASTPTVIDKRRSTEPPSNVKSSNLLRGVDTGVLEEGAVGGVVAPSTTTSTVVPSSQDKSGVVHPSMDQHGPNDGSTMKDSSLNQGALNAVVDKMVSKDVAEAEVVSSSGTDSMDYEDGSVISVDSELLSRSSFNTKSVLHDDGHLNHDKMLEWALPKIDTSRLKLLAATSFPSVANKHVPKSETSLPYTSTPVTHVSTRRTRKPKKTNHDVAGSEERWNLSKLLEQYKGTSTKDSDPVK